MDVGDHGDRPGEVVEDDEHVGGISARSGTPTGSGLCSQRLDRAHEVIREHPDSATRERQSAPPAPAASSGAGTQPASSAAASA